MHYDKFKRPIFNDSDLIEILYEKNLECLNNTLVEASSDVLKFNTFTDNLLKVRSNDTIDQETFDQTSQQEWFMPEEYKKMDIESYLVQTCPEENYQRLIEELQEFRKRNMLDLLRWLKYFVDTAKQRNIIWGVGRGSSVASYVLYLIGVHKIDSIKYKLDWKEFLR
jgi:DNA polymerase III alpha subunit